MATLTPSAPQTFIVQVGQQLEVLFTTSLPYQLSGVTYIPGVPAAPGFPPQIDELSSTTFNLIYTPPLGSEIPGLYPFSISVVFEDAPTQTFGPYAFQVVVVCIAGNTQILMADSSTKEIKSIKRGELVAADPSNTKQYRVAKLDITRLSAESQIDICEIAPNSLAENIPSEKLLITSLHPIVDLNGKKRRHAHKYVNYPGVKRFQNVKAANILDEYCLYDLQFETVGSYVANGLTIQSRNPRSFITPLSRELYFDETLYDGKIMDDNDPANEFPLDYTLLDKK